jgi:alkaline phosphatase
MKRISLSLLFALVAIMTMAQAKYVFYFIGDGMGPNQVLAAAVPIFAIGVGSERFTGWHDNSEIAPLIYQATRE